MNDSEIEAALTPGGSYTDLPGREVTVNQIVAWNMAYFRKAAQLKQEELGEQLGWSKSIVSAAERSWDGDRPRHFTADDLVAVAMALGIPVTALFLPPVDDGVNTRYQFHVAATATSMRDLLSFVMPEPGDDDTPQMGAYRRRYVTAVNTYLDNEGGAELAQYLDDLTTEDRVVDRLARLRAQHEALRGLLTDVDRLQEALTGRLVDIREGRPWVSVGRTPGERDKNLKIAQLAVEMFGRGADLTTSRWEQVMTEARKRGIITAPDDVGGDGL